MRRPGLIAILVLSALAPALPARAQKPIPETVRMVEPHRLRAGDYVRAWPTAEGPPVSGVVVGFSATTLTVAGRQEAALVTLPTLDHLEVRRRHAHAGRGALIGAGLGLFLSFWADDVFNHHLDGWERAGWTAGVTAAGAGAGALVGDAVRTERWLPVDIVTLRPLPAPPRSDGGGPGLRWAWTVRF